MQLQQGDVLLRTLDRLPDGCRVKQAGGRLVLAEGEATGHAHVVDADDAKLIEAGERLLIQLESRAVLTHEEHGPVTLEPGIYDVGRVQEWDYLSQMARNIAD